MSVIYKSLKEIKGMRSKPVKGGVVPHQAGKSGKRALFIIVGAVVLGSLALAGTGLWLQSMLDDSPMPTGPLRHRPATESAQQAAPQPAPLRHAPSGPAQGPAQVQAQPGQPGVDQAQTGPSNAANGSGPIIASTQAASPQGVTAVTQSPGALSFDAPETLDALSEKQSGPLETASAITGEPSNASNEAKDKIVVTLKLPPEPVDPDQKAKKEEEEFVSNVRRNQRVMALQQQMETARRRHDAQALDKALASIEKILGPNSFLVLQWKGGQAIMNKHYGTAEQMYRSALTIKPQDKHCRINLVLSMVGAGKIQAAESEVRRLENNYPGDREVDRLRDLVDYRKRNPGPPPLAQADPIINARDVP